MSRKNRRLASILCGIFIAVLLVSGVLIATHLHHDCPGENCLVCAAISTWEQLLRSMALAAALGSVLLLVQHSSGISMAACCHGAAAQTLVSLKVKLSD